VAQLGDEARRPAARQRLRELGAAAQEALLRGFPGPVLIDRDSLVPGRYPPIEEHGPVLALLLELGPLIVPALPRELESPVIANRFYACLLLGRLAGEQSCELLLPRLYDGVGLVRQAAREALVRQVSTPGFAAVRARLTSDLIEAEGERVRYALEATVWFRDTESVELLIPLLGHRDPPLQELARNALRELTRQDFGLTVRNWRRWYGKNRHRDRLEWLIDALVTEELELRSQAAQELHKLTGQRIPFDPAGPRKEWKRAQSDWLAWRRSHGPGQ
jgi:HEAT repeat protein